jgi:SAM-dependent methyltransferase
MLGPDHAARRRLRVLRRAISSPPRVWERGLQSELDFWTSYVETKGLDFPDEFASLVDPRTPIRDGLLLDAVDRIARQPTRILDVGAGPLTSVGHRHPQVPDRRIVVVAVDPLGSQFLEILRRAGVSPPVITRPCRGEDLLSVFGSEQFDIAYARNSIDHAAEPMTIIENMLDVVHVGGMLVLHHYRREGENMRYEQLHQWNFDVRDGRLLLFGRRHRYDVGSELGERASMTAAVHEGNYHASWVAATITRTA